MSDLEIKKLAEMIREFDEQPTEEKKAVLREMIESSLGVSTHRRDNWEFRLEALKQSHEIFEFYCDTMEDVEFIRKHRKIIDMSDERIAKDRLSLLAECDDQLLVARKLWTIAHEGIEEALFL